MRGFAGSDDALNKMCGGVFDRLGVALVSLRMSPVAVVDHKVTVAVPCAPLGADYFDDTRPWIASMIVVGKARTQMAERTALHLDVGHRHVFLGGDRGCLLYTSPSPRDRTRSRMPSSA